MRVDPIWTRGTIETYKGATNGGCPEIRLSDQENDNAVESR